MIDTNERISPEAQHEIIMRMVFEVCESLLPEGADWLPAEAEHQIAAIDQRLRYALRLDTASGRPATLDRQPETHSS